MVCCCVKIRIPRTKQEIEADYQRKKLTREFQKQLKQIKNEEMDIMDLKRALETIHKEIYSIQDTTDPPLSHSSSINAPASINSSESHKMSDDGMVAEPQKPTPEWTKSEGGLNRTFSQKVSALLKLSKLKNLPTLDDEDNIP
ncbi:uncharacterized protein LOC123300185 isoform X2 [Chrysoperla carnea]|nr:uncharacterized protein LOC123300185 isoform X2 [Chrysoperla carnea]